MRKLMFAAILSLVAGMAHAGDESQAWSIRNGDNWTQNDNVQVRYYFTDQAGLPLGEAQLFIGPLLPTDPARPVITSQFINTGKTVCLNAEAFRSADSGTTVTATPKCHTFRFGPLNPPTIIDNTL